MGEHAKRNGFSANPKSISQISTEGGLAFRARAWLWELGENSEHLGRLILGPIFKNTLATYLCEVHFERRGLSLSNTNAWASPSPHSLQSSLDTAFVVCTCHPVSAQFLLCPMKRPEFFFPTLYGVLREQWQWIQSSLFGDISNEVESPWRWELWASAQLVFC